MSLVGQLGLFFICWVHVTFWDLHAYLTIKPKCGLYNFFQHFELCSNQRGMRGNRMRIWRRQELEREEDTGEREKNVVEWCWREENWKERGRGRRYKR